jgi:hypothetical protein
MEAGMLWRFVVSGFVIALVVLFGECVALAEERVLNEDTCEDSEPWGEFHSRLVEGSWDTASNTCTFTIDPSSPVTTDRVLIGPLDRLTIPFGTTLKYTGKAPFMIESGSVVNYGTIDGLGSSNQLQVSVWGRVVNHGVVSVRLANFGSKDSNLGHAGFFDNYGSFTISERLWNLDGDIVNFCRSMFSAKAIVGNPPINEPCPGVGLVNPKTGSWHLLHSDGRESSFYYGNPHDSPTVGDWDCDGTDTAGLFRQTDAYAYLRNSNTPGIANTRFFFGNPSDIPLAGDFNGDGCDTLSIYRPSEARFYIINNLGENEGGLGAAEYSFLFGNMGDKPVVGDWDGDGIDEIGLHRESTGLFYWRNTLDTGNADGTIFFGDPGDRFVAGDWGIVDGKDTPGLFRPSNTTFYFRHTLTEGNADSQFVFGMPGWIPVAGDFGFG